MTAEAGSRRRLAISGIDIATGAKIDIPTARNSWWRKAVRAAGNLEIYVALFFLFLAGAWLIRDAHDVAGLPVISTLGNATLFPADRRAPDYEAHEHEVLSHFISELGIALVVAALLGMTFEFFMRRREAKAHIKHLKEIEKAALSSLLGHFMPPALFNEIKRVFGQSIIRANLEVSYKFEKLLPKHTVTLDQPSIDPRDLLLVTVSVEYDLVNLTTSSVDHVIHHGFESILPFGHNYNKFLSLDITVGKEPWIEWRHGQHSPRVQFPPGPASFIRVLQVRDTISIEPGEETSGWPVAKKRVHVVVRHQLVRRRRDLDSWTSWLPADGLAINVEVAEEDALALEFHVERMHPDKFKPEPNHSGTKCRWTLPVSFPERYGKQVQENIAVLPFQGFTLFWFPRHPLAIKK